MLQTAFEVLLAGLISQRNAQVHQYRALSLLARLSLDGPVAGRLSKRLKRLLHKQHAAN